MAAMGLARISAKSARAQLAVFGFSLAGAIQRERFTLANVPARGDGQARVALIDDGPRTGGLEHPVEQLALFEVLKSAVGPGECARLGDGRHESRPGEPA